jgi:hypothetical protein
VSIAAGALATVGLLCGVATAAKTYPDRPGDVTGGSGPDIVSVRVSSTAASITFRVRFAHAPPLRVSARGGWVDMLLVGIDVPPLGPRPSAPGGEWPGADFALGTHGPSTTGRLVRLGDGMPPSAWQVATVRIATRGSTVTLSIPRRVLGSPGWFTFAAAAARERQRASGGGVDLVPGRGAYRYTLS